MLSIIGLLVRVYDSDEAWHTRDHEPIRSMTETLRLRGTKEEYGPFFTDSSQ
jgi:hypothetical protein